MLQNKLSSDAIMELKSECLAEFCETMLDAKQLVDDVENDPRLDGRKGLCQYLGIGESTLSGWLREDRIPLAAKEAYVLRIALQVLQREIRNLRRQQSVGISTDEISIVKSGDTYNLCKFRRDENSALISNVIAENIRDIDIARLLSTSAKSMEILEKSISHLEWAEEDLRSSGSENAIEFADEIEIIVNDINEQRAFATDYVKWKRDFCTPPMTEEEILNLLST